MTRSLALAWLSLCLAVVSSGCASSGERAVTSGQTMTLQVGERVALPDGTSLRYVEVIADSRCPPKVQCIRAGDADVAFTFVPASGAPISVNLNTPEAPSAPIGEWQLRLLGLEFGEAPRATLRINTSANP